MWIAITIAVAALGGLIFRRLGVPAGMLLGAVVAAALLNISTARAYVWPQARVAAQILAGIWLGCSITKSDLKLLPRLAGPYLIIMGGFLALNIGAAFLLYAITEQSLITCLFSAMPGGISDAPLVAMDMGADAAVVTILQFIRVMFGLGCLPWLITMAERAKGRRPEHREHMKAGPKERSRLRPFLPTLCAGVPAGLLGYLSGIPAGTIAAAMFAAAAISLAGKGQPMPGWLRTAAQLLCGCSIGIRVEAEHILHFGSLLLPAAILCAGYMLLCLAGGYIISRAFKFSFKEAILFLAPAGSVEMAFIAADLGVDSPALAILQMFRLIGVVLLFPQIFGLLAGV